MTAHIPKPTRRIFILSGRFSHELTAQRTRFTFILTFARRGFFGLLLIQLSLQLLLRFLLSYLLLLLYPQFEPLVVLEE